LYSVINDKIILHFEDRGKSISFMIPQEIDKVTDIYFV
jgi:hypothetical protein